MRTKHRKVSTVASLKRLGKGISLLIPKNSRHIATTATRDRANVACVADVAAPEQSQMRIIRIASVAAITQGF
jgi:hypothetical protein